MTRPDRVLTVLRQPPDLAELAAGSFDFDLDLDLDLSADDEALAELCDRTEDEIRSSYGPELDADRSTLLSGLGLRRLPAIANDPVRRATVLRAAQYDRQPGDLQLLRVLLQQEVRGALLQSLRAADFDVSTTARIPTPPAGRRGQARLGLVHLASQQRRHREVEAAGILFNGRSGSSTARRHCRLPISRRSIVVHRNRPARASLGATVRGLLAGEHGLGLCLEVDVRFAADVDGDAVKGRAGERPGYRASSRTASCGPTARRVRRRSSAC
ncbi:hypothetical protein [Streptomyces sp. NRRL S-448]|uniref:hypothetical protein n=1 Tax=Streptomyces sp. NRRL S-448 TaxID=1463907 RepID=UPI0035630C09